MLLRVYSYYYSLFLFLCVDVNLIKKTIERVLAHYRGISEK